MNNTTSLVTVELGALNVGNYILARNSMNGNLTTIPYTVDRNILGIWLSVHLECLMQVHSVFPTDMSLNEMILNFRNGDLVFEQRSSNIVLTTN